MEASARHCSLVKPLRKVGIVPVRAFPCSLRVPSDDNALNSVGTVPVSELGPRETHCKFVRREKPCGIVPVK